MAKKTKHQKIIAQLRRQLKAQENFGSVPIEKVNETKEDFPVNQKLQPKTLDFPDLSTLGFLKKDLSKTFILSLAIFTIEIFLYWKF